MWCFVELDSVWQRPGRCLQNPIWWFVERRLQCGLCLHVRFKIIELARDRVWAKVYARVAQMLWREESVWGMVWLESELGPRLVFRQHGNVAWAAPVQRVPSIHEQVPRRKHEEFRGVQIGGWVEECFLVFVLGENQGVIESLRRGHG